MIRPARSREVVRSARLVAWRCGDEADWATGSTPELAVA